MMLRQLLVLLLLAAPLQAAEAPKAEKLAGEDDKAIPTAVPTALGDERGPVRVSRTPQAAPSFDLPAFVVTGSGERKALARREDLGTRLDTSGGIKTSPGESGAGKDQLEAQAVRAGLEQVTYTSKPFIGRLRANAGTAATYGLDGLVAQELGRFWWGLQAGADGDEGGAVRPPMTDKALRDKGRLAAQAGWRFDEGRSVSAFGYGDYRNANPSVLTGSRLRHTRTGGGAEWRGPLAGLGSRLRLQGGQASAAMAGLQLSEDQAALDLGLEKRLNGRTGSALLELGAQVESLSRDLSLNGRSSLLLARGSFSSTFEPWQGSRLGLGVAVDSVSGDQSAFQFSPRLRLEQRVGTDLRVSARLDGGLAVSRLDGPAFDQAQRISNPSLKPAAQRVDAALKLEWQALAPLSLWAEAFARQSVDAFMPSPISGEPVYADMAVRSYNLMGLRLGSRWQQGPWWQSLEAAFQRPELPDQSGDWATFVPWWTGEAAFGGRWGQLSGELRASLQGDQHGALDGSLPLAAAVDVSALLDYAFNEAWSLFVEGRNLAGQRVEPLALYPSPAPYAGAGVELRF